MTPFRYTAFLLRPHQLSHHDTLAAPLPITSLSSPTSFTAVSDAACNQLETDIENDIAGGPGADGHEFLTYAEQVQKLKDDPSYMSSLEKNESDNLELHEVQTLAKCAGITQNECVAGSASGQSVAQKAKRELEAVAAVASGAAAGSGISLFTQDADDPAITTAAETTETAENQTDSETDCSGMEMICNMMPSHAKCGPCGLS